MRTTSTWQRHGSAASWWPRASGGFSTGAGELAIGLAIALLRQIPAMDAAVKSGQWPTPMGQELNGKTLGIVGLGQIGRHVARIANVFGMRVLSWSRHPDDGSAAAVGAMVTELDDLLRASDIVSVHATLSPHTRGLLDARRLALMKPTAYLINTARGAIVDEAALVDALANRRIAGAGLDVFDSEPLPPGHPLTALTNVDSDAACGLAHRPEVRAVCAGRGGRAAGLPGRARGAALSGSPLSVIAAKEHPRCNRRLPTWCSRCCCP